EPKGYPDTRADAKVFPRHPGPRRRRGIRAPFGGAIPLPVVGDRRGVRAVPRGRDGAHGSSIAPTRRPASDLLVLVPEQGKGPIRGWGRSAGCTGPRNFSRLAFSSVLRRWLMLRAQRRRPTVPPSVRPRLEVLEARCLLDANVLQTNLVSDLPGVAKVTDSHLVNPWGISESGTSAFWISDNGTGVSTLYNGAGVPQPQPTPTNPNAQPLVVNIPSPDDPNGGGTPTGTVFNITLGSSTPGFVVSKGGKSAPAIFLFATEDGTISGWAPS